MKYIVTLRKHWTSQVTTENNLSNGKKSIKLVTIENDTISKEKAIKKIINKLKDADFNMNEVIFNDKKNSTLKELEELLNQEN